MKLQQMKQGQYFLTLPSQIVKAKDWKKGDMIKVKINKEGAIVLYRQET